jgi:hypothetical protein
MNSIVSILLAGVIVVTSVSFWPFSMSDAQERLNTIPLESPEFQGQDIPIKKAERELFQNVNILKRLYIIDNKEFFVTVLDGTNNRQAISDPYKCFKNFGWTIEDEQTLPIKGGYASLLEMSKEGEKREALLWYSDGNSPHSSSNRYWLQTTLRNLSFGFSGNEPVLIVIQPLEGGKIDWDKFFKDFPQILEV